MVSAARVTTRCSRLLPDRIITGRPVSPRSSSPCATLSACARTSPHVERTHSPSGPRSATSRRSGCTSACARNEWTTLTGCSSSGSVERSTSRPSGRCSASTRGAANGTGRSAVGVLIGAGPPKGDCSPRGCHGAPAAEYLPAMVAAVLRLVLLVLLTVAFVASVSLIFLASTGLLEKAVLAAVALVIAIAVPRVQRLGRQA